MINCSVIITLVLHSLQDPHASGLSPFNVQRSRGFGPRLCICFREEGALTLFIAPFSVKGLIIATGCKPARLFHSLYRVTWQLFPWREVEPPSSPLDSQLTWGLAWTSRILKRCLFGALVSRYCAHLPALLEQA